MHFNIFQPLVTADVKHESPIRLPTSRVYSTESADGRVAYSWNDRQMKSMKAE